MIVELHCTRAKTISQIQPEREEKKLKLIRRVRIFCIFVFLFFFQFLEFCNYSELTFVEYFFYDLTRNQQFVVAS